MTVAVDCLLAAGVLAAWFGVAAFVRLPTALQRLHAVTFVTIVAGTPIVAAALLDDGVSAGSLKCVFILVVLLPMGALLAHVTGRALHLREGGRP
jgi:multicomponent Na+:H+ antiporter subunit G